MMTSSCRNCLSWYLLTGLKQWTRSWTGRLGWRRTSRWSPTAAITCSARSVMTKVMTISDGCNNARPQGSLFAFFKNFKVRYLEHVQCRVSLKYHNRGNLRSVSRVHQSSPSSKLRKSRKLYKSTLGLSWPLHEGPARPSCSPDQRTSWRPALRTGLSYPSTTGARTPLASGLSRWRKFLFSIQSFWQIENAGGEAKASGLLKHWQLVLYGTEESPLPTSEKPHTSSTSPPKQGECRM